MLKTLVDWYGEKRKRKTIQQFIILSTYTGLYLTIGTEIQDSYYSIHKIWHQSKINETYFSIENNVLTPTQN